MIMIGYVNIAFVIVGIYATLILYFYSGWKKLKEFKANAFQNPLKVSIVVACRNEEENILYLLDCLVNQTYPKHKTEIIVVNDHSTDNTENLIIKFCKKHKIVRLLNLPNNLSGKKEAVSYAIGNANTEIIITTDADCTMNKNWVHTLMAYYEINKPKLISAPVKFGCQNIFQKLQALEFTSLIASGAGAIGVNRAIMCNGANMLFQKSLFTECNLKNNEPSGDDVFLMLHAKSVDKKSIHFVKSYDAVVNTKAAINLRDFFQQRIRWTSKSKLYRDFDIIFTAVIVASLNIILAIGFVKAFINLSFTTIGILLLIKTIADLPLMILASRLLKSEKLLYLFLPLQFLYPFYITLTVMFGFAGNFTWKARKFR
jgi:cellulose synthase/poly-beta-1,6-N-acetylglucosamine synthase-like glycosyltransferase